MARGRERDWPGYVELPVAKLGTPSPGPAPDPVAVEHYLSIEVAGRALVTLACTPTDLEELVAGHLVARGLAPVDRTPGDAGFACRFSGDRRLAQVTLGAGSGTGGGDGAGRVAAGDGADFVASGCGAGLVTDQARLLMDPGVVTWEGRVPAGRLRSLVHGLQDAPLYRLTGGTHSAAAVTPDSDAGRLRYEDIGRHNAVDKVIGGLWLAGRLPGPHILATSGRISSDVVLKAARAGFPVVVSRGAPTVMAVELARTLGLTVAGFGRGKRLNLYAGFERIDQ